MNKKLKKALILLFITTIVFFNITPISMATEGLIQVNTIQANGNSAAADDMVVVVGRILGLVRNIAVVLAVVIIAYLGIKFIMGSPEEKSEYQKSFIPLVVGIVVVVGAVQIATMLFGVVE